MIRRIEVVPHDPEWAGKYRAEGLRLREVLGDNVVAIHHIGSTAISGILAKPIIDILVEVRDLAKVDALNEKMTLRGYLPQGEFGIPERRYFRKGTDSHHTYHVHVFRTGNSRIEHYLNFRDYLRTHPLEAQAYSRLKERLARKFTEDIEGYMDGKDGLIKKIEKKATVWRDGMVSSSRKKRGIPLNRSH